MYRFVPDKKAILITIILISLLVVVQFLNKKHISHNTNTTASSHIDYYINNFATRIFRKDGTLDYILTGQRLNHYKDTQHVTISLPLLTYQKDSIWTVSSQLATTSEALNQEITFTDNALIKQQGDEALSIQAESIAFTPKNKRFIANSDKKDVYINWKTGNIRGSEMIADIQKEEFILKNVEAVYQTQ